MCNMKYEVWSKYVSWHFYSPYSFSTMGSLIIEFVYCRKQRSLKCSNNSKLYPLVNAVNLNKPGPFFIAFHSCEKAAPYASVNTCFVTGIDTSILWYNCKGILPFSQKYHLLHFLMLWFQFHPTQPFPVTKQQNKLVDLKIIYKFYNCKSGFKKVN